MEVIQGGFVKQKKKKPEVVIPMLILDTEKTIDGENAPTEEDDVFRKVPKSINMSQVQRVSEGRHRFKNGNDFQRISFSEFDPQA